MPLGPGLYDQERAAYLRARPVAAPAPPPPASSGGTGGFRRPAIRRQAAPAASFAPASIFTPEEERLQALRMAGITAERAGTSEALARQLEMLAQQQRWLEEQVGRDIGRIETERPELLGRLGSSFAARGSFHSGARREAEGDLTQQLAQQIEDMRTGLVQGQQQAVWRRAQLNVEALQAMEDLARQEEAAQLKWTLQGQARQEALRGGGGGRRGGGGGGAGGAGSFEDMSFAARTYRNSRFNFYRSPEGGNLLPAAAAARAITEMKTRHPGLPEEVYYSGDVGELAAPIGAPTAAQERQVYEGALAAARRFLTASNLSRPDNAFLAWYVSQLPREAQREAGQFQSVILSALNEIRNQRRRR